MAEADVGAAPSAAAGPRTSAPVPCATCAAPVDRLRAPAVRALADGGFRYFCGAVCRERWASAAEPTGPAPLPPAPVGGPTELAVRRRTATALERVVADELSELTDEELRELPGASSPPVESHGDGTQALLAIAAVAAALVLGLTVAAPDAGHALVRQGLLAIGWSTLFVRFATTPRPPVEQPYAALLAAPTIATVLSILATLVRAEDRELLTVMAAVSLLTTIASHLLLERGRAPWERERGSLDRALDQPARRVVGDDLVAVAGGDLRPGEEIVLETGDVVPVDATVSAGEARVQPWLGARRAEARRAGDVLVAGGRVLRGRVRAVVAWAGHDRAWARLTSDPRRRADLRAPLARWGHAAAEQLAPLVASLVALIAFAGGQSWVRAAAVGVATLAALGTPAVAQLPGLSMAWTVLRALRRGIVFRSAEELDRAGQVTTVVFSATGTLLRGQPAVVSVEPLGDATADEVLALAAAAEAIAAPQVTPCLDAARERGIRPVPLRGPQLEPSGDLRAVDSQGRVVLVGRHEALLARRVSVATAESRIAELEGLGRSVLLVARDDRLVGLLALRDALRPGARVAVRNTYAAGAEPVLMSSEPAAAADALGRSLDIDHVRGGVPVSAMADEVRRLADAGAVVAVVGRSPEDDAALGAAHVSIALAAAGSASTEWSVKLASDGVADAAYAVLLAQQGRAAARAALLWTLVPAAVASAGAAAGALPTVTPPVVAAAFAAVALIRWSGAAARADRSGDGPPDGA